MDFKKIAIDVLKVVAALYVWEAVLAPMLEEKKLLPESRFEATELE